MHVLRAVLTWVAAVPCVAVGTLVAAQSVYLLTLAGAAFRRRPSGPTATPTSRLAVLVPAHDEEALVARTVASLRAQRYPDHLLRIVVLADNCTDDTARIASAAGADVMVRDDPAARGKGQALRWGMDRLLAADPGLDGIVVVDADSVADPELLSGLESRMAAGAPVVQAEYLVLADPGSTGSELRAAAFLLFHRVRFAGRAALGLPCSLVGNGMLFSRSLLETHPWSAFTGAEDLEYSTDLRLAGVHPVFAANARVCGPALTYGRGASTQRLRWEGGRAHVVRTRLPALLRAALLRRDASLLDAALDLAVPPLGLLAMLSAVGVAAAAALIGLGAVSPLALVPWVSASLLLPAYVLVGLRAAHAPASTYRALLQTPRFLLAKLGTYRRLATGLRADRWDRTERVAESTAPSTARFSIAGVPIDPVDMDEAVARVMSMVGSPTCQQVCTVNIQFLVTARRRADVGDILRAGAMNVADGAPVVWLGRRLGHRVAQRVAGADLVPAVMRASAASGASIFLLGGQGGSAEEAARRMSAAHPGLRVAGTCEPPLAALEDLDHEEILRRIADSGADILFVALGHPKQERWIAMHRDRLTVSVAMGVGCSLDLLAGRQPRAAGWMQRCGLEWLFRVLHDPRRLARRYMVDAVWLLVVIVPALVGERLLRRG